MLVCIDGFPSNTPTLNRKHIEGTKVVVPILIHFHINSITGGTEPVSNFDFKSKLNVKKEEEKVLNLHK